MVVDVYQNEDRKLAVCMAAYNASKTVERAIQSILEQSYSRFTLVLVDDGSTDNTAEILKSIDDPRICILENRENLGVANIRNKMLRHCRSNDYKYMAIMDADDIAYPDRLLGQIEILESNSAISACGSSMLMEKDGGVWHAPVQPGDVKAETIFANPIPSPMAMYRIDDLCSREIFWNQNFEPCEDYHFWYQFLFVNGLKATSTGDIQGVYCYTPDSVSNRDGRSKQESMDVEVKRLILKNIGVEAERKDLEHFMSVSLYRSSDRQHLKGFSHIAEEILRYGKWLDIELEINARTRGRIKWFLEHGERLNLLGRLKLFQLSTLARLKMIKRR